ncbi:hydroxymyristoyl-ACP dehydratase [Kribbella albertanoniae]|uniref:Hydroxymyristoyl-ACP dehydratase n=2 Tax=Kribbella albertanoniae TaxID=1266829 RepID=A0A4R4QEU8_9ACTN|nr:hydroxymyristoyl-ACP dehydratase [Kribbella albertanoniae]
MDLAVAATASGLDTVVSLRPGVAAVATKNFPATTAIFATHFPRFPVVPGVLLLDDLARLAALVLAGDGGPDRWRLAAVTRIRFRHFVRPGDVAELSVEVRSDGDGSTLRGEVRVDGKPVTTVGSLVMRDTTSGAVA